MRVFTSPLLPHNKVFIVPDGFLEHPAFEVGFREDPWGVAPFGAPRDERAKALDYLAGLLDNLCERHGMDPDEVWRNPKIAERDSLWRGWAFDERVSMPIINPRAVVTISGV